MHALVTCAFTQAVWEESTLPVMNITADSFQTWFLEIMKILTPDQFIMAAALLYYIWRARNQAVWEHFLPRPKRVVQAAAAAWQAWATVHAGVSTAASSSAGTSATSHSIGAAAVENGLPKVYIDAGYHATNGNATAGAIVLTSGGEFMACFHMQLPDCLSLLMAEALACKDALSWLKEKD
ncbi:PREDICTED: uncharacterized protein LOC109175461 [Ipomoea nil]|uniref:uncharacterized protein LOC109175461 n=1 Tax=Ipomoea nil TaxID=35883 RepID=UPI0009009890|nr:PREDICTED: uncharacterized protein LOC109175461 [Ipomoea nil]